MASYSFQKEISSLKEEMFTLHRQIKSQAGNYKSSLDGSLEEEEVIYTELLYYINQAMEDNLEPQDAEELKEILKEVEVSHQTIGRDIITIFSGF